jgi:thiol-disulfide isomerase/thioredoxin
VIGKGRRHFANLCMLVLCTLPAMPAAAETPMNPAHFDLSAYKGKVVYLDFWASWCGPCRFSFPYMNHLARTFAGRDLVIIADNLDHSRASADAFLEETGADFPIMYDQKGVLASRFNVSAMPTSILIGRDGRIRYTHHGFFKDKEDEYTSHVLELLNEMN